MRFDPQRVQELMIVVKRGGGLTYAGELAWHDGINKPDSKVAAITASYFSQTRCDVGCNLFLN